MSVVVASFLDLPCPVGRGWSRREGGPQLPISAPIHIYSMFNSITFSMRPNVIKTKSLEFIMI